MKALSLFAGIGGLDLALDNIAETCAYCEINPHAQSILKARMEDEELYQGPIFDDVRTLNASDLPQDIEAVFASFPCVDISPARGVNRPGVNGPKSGLAHDVYRIVKDLPNVKLVVFENSNCIYNMGLDDLLAPYIADGFRVAHAVFGANEVGGKHTRRRFFCIATKAPIPQLRVRIPDFDLTSPEPDRLVLTEFADRKRMERLGNAVVPACVKLAYKTLRDALNGDLPTERRLKNHLRTITVADSNGTQYYTKPHFETTANLDLVSFDGTTTKSHQLWPTPTLWGAGALKMAPTTSRPLLQPHVLYERGTIDWIRQRHPDLPLENVQDIYRVNPEFVEYLMGFPRGWTATSPSLIIPIRERVVSVDFLQWLADGLGVTL